MRELVFKYFWIVALVVSFAAPYIIWTAKSLFDIISSFIRTLKSRNSRLYLTEQMKLYISDSTEFWLTFHIFAAIFISFICTLGSFIYYLTTIE